MKKEFKKKLSLNKQTIDRLNKQALNNDLQNDIKGGVNTTDGGASCLNTCYQCPAPSYEFTCACTQDWCPTVVWMCS